MLIVSRHSANHGYAKLTSEMSSRRRMIRVGVRTQNMTDAAIAHFQDVLNVLVDCGTGINNCQVFSADNVRIGSRPCHNARVGCN